MRLHQLDARLMAISPDGGMRAVDSLAGAQALSFQCPACARFCRPTPDGKAFIGAHHLLLCFRNPRGAVSVAEQHHGHTGWWIEGSSLDDLTFDHGTPPQPKSIGVGASNEHAHFFITGGTITDLTGNGRPPSRNPLATMDSLDTTTNPDASDAEQQAAFARSARIEQLIAEGKTQDEALALVDQGAPDPAPAPIADIAPDPLEEPPREEEQEELEPDTVTLKVRAIAPGYDGLKFREKGDVFPLTLVRGRTAPSWVELAEG